MDCLPMLVEGFVADIGALLEIEGQLDVGLDVGVGIVVQLVMGEVVVDWFVRRLFFWLA